MATRIVTDGTQERVVEAPRVVLPVQPDAFRERASRLSQLAEGHAMGDYLRLMATVAEGQQRALAGGFAPAVEEAALAASRAHGMPPLAALSHSRAAQWRADLAAIVTHVRAGANGRMLATLAELDTLESASIEALADRVLGGTTLDEDAAFVPLIGAALQVYFLRAAAALNAADLQSFDVPTVCPVCATRPVMSVVRMGGTQANLRYLVCALCATEWHMVRIKCSSCELDKGLKYLMIDLGDGRLNDAAMRAEACDECRSYLKVIYQEKDPPAEPNADDLATFALDVLVDEQGYARSGPNLLLHPGTG